MYLSCFVYVALAALLVWGGKFAGFKKNFNDDFMSLEATKSLRGLAALGVMLHHIAQEKAFRDAGELSFFPEIGFLFVAVFFFCSGYGLLKSLRTKPDYLKTFFSKRILALLVPFYVNTIFFALFIFLSGQKMPVAQWIVSFTGISLMNRFAWYVIVILILYLVFYFSFSRVKSERVCVAIIFCAVLLQGAAACVIGHFAWWAGPKNWWLASGALQNAAWWKGMAVSWFHGEWWANSSIAFALGMAFASCESRAVEFLKRRYWLKFALLLALTAASFALANFTQRRFGYWSEFSGRGPGVANKFICYGAQLLQVGFFTAALFALTMKYRVVNRATKFFGELSLETYLMQLIPLTAFRFLIYKDGEPFLSAGRANLALYTLVVLSSTVALAIALKLIDKKILAALSSKFSAARKQ